MITLIAIVAKKFSSRLNSTKKEIVRITPGTRGGLAGRDRPLAVKSRKSAFFVKNGFLKKLRWAHQTSSLGKSI